MIVLSGASASGKTEVAKMLAKKYGITKMITTTTRDLRVGEVNGKDYFFVSKQQFEIMLRQDKFVEHTIYNGNFYGSTKDQIANNRCVVIDPAGLRSYINLRDNSIVTFFLDSTEDTRHQRMIERGDLEDKIKSRLIHDREAFAPSNIPKVDFHVNSETTSVEEVADEIYKIYNEEMNRRFPKK
ncbi:MAG: guanylate kinase [Bacilli bacterium]|nr:guanylate kinase [Bacilli bacterium]